MLSDSLAYSSPCPISLSAASNVWQSVKSNNTNRFKSREFDLEGSGQDDDDQDEIDLEDFDELESL